MRTTLGFLLLEGNLTEMWEFFQNMLVLTLSYQRRRLSCPHMQMLVEQSSLQTQYCEGKQRHKHQLVTLLNSLFPLKHQKTSNPPAGVWCSGRCSWATWRSFLWCICSRLGSARCPQNSHKEWKLAPGLKICRCQQKHTMFLSLKAHFWSYCWANCIKVPTCEAVSLRSAWAVHFWRPSPSCVHARRPRPWSCGCSSPEESLPRGSSETH